MRCPSTFPLDWLLIFLKLTAEDRKPRIKSKLAHLMSQNWTHLLEHFQSKLCKFIMNPSVRHLGYLSRTHYTPDISKSMAILIRWPLTTSRGKERFSEHHKITNNRSYEQIWEVFKYYSGVGDKSVKFLQFKDVIIMTCQGLVWLELVLKTFLSLR